MFYNAVGTPLSDAKVKTLIEAFSKRHAQELHRKYNFDEDAIDQALTQIRDEKAYRIDWNLVEQQKLSRSSPRNMARSE